MILSALGSTRGGSKFGYCPDLRELGAELVCSSGPQPVSGLANRDISSSLSSCRSQSFSSVLSCTTESYVNPEELRFPARNMLKDQRRLRTKCGFVELQ